MFNVACKSCGARLALPENLAGAPCKCVRCGSVFVAPASDFPANATKAQAQQALALLTTAPATEGSTPAVGAGRVIKRPGVSRGKVWLVGGDNLSVGEVLFACVGLGASGGILGAAVLSIILFRSLAGVPCSLAGAFPGALAGAVAAGPLAAAGNRRIGWVVAASAGVLAGAGLTWFLSEMLSGLGG